MIPKRWLRNAFRAILAVCLVLLPVSAAETEETLTSDAPFICPYHLYFGLLHAHTDLSDGLGSVEEAFSFAAASDSLDFFAVTDHSNSFDNAENGSLTTDGCGISAEWAAGKAAAKDATTEDFLALFGFEMTWPEIRQLGHITTFGTPGWISRDQQGFADDPEALANYLEALSDVPGSVSQFCHPGDLYGDFEGFENYRPDWDTSVPLLETLGEGSIRSYVLALDNFWHPAPTGSRNIHDGSFGQDSGPRTVILAEELTEASLFEAIRARRVYATEDTDLHLYWELDGQSMGSILSSAEAPEIYLSLHDPSDTGAATLEVITEGGAVLASQQVSPGEDLIFSVPGGYRWYFLKLTQADGDIAVTAPVWVEGFENMGILSFTADADVPLQNREVILELELYNDESVDFSLDSLELYAQDQLVFRDDAPGTVIASDRLCLRIPYTHPETGPVSLRVVIWGHVREEGRTYEATVSLRFRPEETATGLLLQGSGETMERLKALAREEGMDVTVFAEDMPLGGEILVIPPLQSPPADTFCEDITGFLESGGTLILLANPESRDWANDILKSVNSSLRFGDTTLPEGTTGNFNREAACWNVLSPSQFLRYGESAVLESDFGQWLVTDASGSHRLLAREETPWGGCIYAAGSNILDDPFLSEERSPWEVPTANETFLTALLGTAVQVPEIQCIDRVRWAAEGTLFRIKGYATSGTANPCNAFPEALYLQDDTGGIEVSGFSAPDISLGTSLEVIGTLRIRGGVPVLEYADHRLTGERPYVFTPRTMSCEAAMDYDTYGGQPVQIEGTVKELTLTADRKGISRLTVKDAAGDTAVVEIEDAIRSGSTGKNTLADKIRKDRTVRVLGILHINADGKTVIRVRNCDEVTYIPPKPDPSNPRTADRCFGWLEQSFIPDTLRSA